MKEWMNGTMNGEIWFKNFLPLVRTFRIKHEWIFLHDKDPKHK